MIIVKELTERLAELSTAAFATLIESVLCNEESTLLVDESSDDVDVDGVVTAGVGDDEDDAEPVDWPAVASTCARAVDADDDVEGVVVVEAGGVCEFEFEEEEEEVVESSVETESTGGLVTTTTGGVVVVVAGGVVVVVAGGVVVVAGGVVVVVVAGGVVVVVAGGVVVVVAGGVVVVVAGGVVVVVAGGVVVVVAGGVVTAAGAPRVIAGTKSPFGLAGSKAQCPVEKPCCAAHAINTFGS